VRLDSVLIALVLTATGLSLAAVWMRLGKTPRRRLCESIAIAGLSAADVLGCTMVRGSWDNSENRNNSFPVSDERALRYIHEPLRIQVNLAPEDPRRLDLERHGISKLRRILPDLEVTYVSSTSIGLFEQTRAGYGEIWYQLGSHKTMSRVTTTEGVLEAIYSIAGITPPKEDEEAVYRGRPLAVQPRGAGVVFFGSWPVLVLVSAILVRRSFH